MQPNLYHISLGTETGLDNSQGVAKTRPYFQDYIRESTKVRLAYTWPSDLWQR